MSRPPHDAYWVRLVDVLWCYYWMGAIILAIVAFPARLVRDIIMGRWSLIVERFLERVT